jgi:phosphohistidine phosphatase SixA
MSREIVILRHAQAEPPAPGQGDIERKLSERGRHEAEAVRDWFQRHALEFDAVLCSPATRTRQTLDLVAPGTAVRYDERIYEASPGELIDVLESAPGAGRVLLVGHNPGLEQLLGLLTDGRSEDARGLPTAGVACLRVPTGQALEPGVAHLRAFWSP